MTIPQGICSKCHEDFMHCKCEQFHTNMYGLNRWHIEDLHYSIKQIDDYLIRKESNLMSMVYPNWNKIKDYIKILLENQK